MNRPKEVRVLNGLNSIEWHSRFATVRRNLEKARRVLTVGYDQYSEHELAFRVKAADEMILAEECLAEMITLLDRAELHLAGMRLFLREPAISVSPPAEFE